MTMHVNITSSRVTGDFTSKIKATLAAQPMTVPINRCVLRCLVRENPGFIMITMVKQIQYALVRGSSVPIHSPSATAMLTRSACLKLGEAIFKFEKSAAVAHAGAVKNAARLYQVVIQWWAEDYRCAYCDAFY